MSFGDTDKMCNAAAGTDKPYSAGEAAASTALRQMQQVAAAQRDREHSRLSAPVTWDQPMPAFAKFNVKPEYTTPLSAKYAARSSCKKFDHLCGAQQWQYLQQHAMPDQQLSQQQQTVYQDTTVLQQQAQNLLDQMARAATEQFAASTPRAASDMTRNAYVPHADAALPVAAHSLHAAQQNQGRQLAAHALNPIVADLPSSFVPLQQHGLFALAASPAGHRLHTMQHRSIGSGAMPYASIAAVHTAVPKSSESSLQQAAAMSPLGPQTPDQQAFRQFQYEDNEASSNSTGCSSPLGQGS